MIVCKKWNAVWLWTYQNLKLLQGCYCGGGGGGGEVQSRMFATTNLFLLNFELVFQLSTSGSRICSRKSQEYIFFWHLRVVGSLASERSEPPPPTRRCRQALEALAFLNLKYWFSQFSRYLYSNFKIESRKQWRIQGCAPALPLPPMAQNFLDFMQFLGKFDKIVCWRPLEGRRPLLQGILDPPLVSLKWQFTTWSIMAFPIFPRRVKTFAKTTILRRATKYVCYLVRQLTWICK